MVAMPTLRDNNFRKSFIQICSHTPTGAMGFVLNKRMEREVVQSVAQHIHLESRFHQYVYWGGPVQLDTVMVIHDPDYILPGTKNYGDYSVSRDRQVIRDINANKITGEFKIFLGHCTWGPTQLEHEVYVRNSWSFFESDTNWIFNPMLHWEDALCSAADSQAQTMLDRVFE